MTEENRPTLLHYASPRAADSVREALWRRSVRRFARLWKVLPLPLVAVMLLFPIYLARHYESIFPFVSFELRYQLFEFFVVLAIFLPGALRRADRRSFAIALCGAAVAFCVHELHIHLKFRGFYYSLALMADVAVLFLLAVSEQFASKSRQWRLLGWSAIGAVGAACIISIAVSFLTLGGYRFELPTSRHGRAIYVAGTFFAPLITVVFAWIAIPWSIRAGSSNNWSRKIFSTASVAALTAWISFFIVALMPLARRSLLGRGPFSRASAAWLIDQSGNADDMERIYAELGRADWNEGEDYFEMGPDWKQNSIAVLADRDSPEAASRLSQMFSSHPNARMAEECAWLFAKERRYETAPLLLRYAFIESIPHTYSGEDEKPCVTALEDMRVPQVAREIMNAEWVRLAHTNTVVQFDADTRQRLAKLLGTDAGSDPHQWNALYQKVIASAPTSLSPEQQREADAVTAAIRQCTLACNRLFEAGLSENSIPLPKLDATTTEDFSREIGLYAERADQAIAAQAKQP